jgi:hypothetical protein
MKVSRLLSTIPLIFFSSLSFSEAHALTCNWWQFKRSETIVNKNPKPKAKLRSHPRRETCVDRWKNLSLFMHRFSDKPPEYWDSSIAVFKTRMTFEKEAILSAINETPDYSEMENYYFYRAVKSEFAGNPATIDTKNRSIAFFDVFFKVEKKSKILVHESAHYLYFKLSPSDKDQFLSLSGWSPDKTEPSTLTPPLNLIQDDSKNSHDEDFANHLEEFYSSPEQYKKQRPLPFDFFNSRFKK